MLFVDLGTEINLGLVLDGRIHLGVQGAAGQLGHIYLGEGHDKICGCGNVSRPRNPWPLAPPLHLKGCGGARWPQSTAEGGL